MADQSTVSKAKLLLMMTKLAVAMLLAQVHFCGKLFCIKYGLRGINGKLHVRQLLLCRNSLSLSFCCNDFLLRRNGGRRRAVD